MNKVTVLPNYIQYNSLSGIYALAFNLVFSFFSCLLFAKFTLERGA
ncbi:MAG: hypothetical protein P1P64_05170 [Treponemataceae bacterium]